MPRSPRLKSSSCRHPEGSGALQARLCIIVRRHGLGKINDPCYDGRLSHEKDRGHIVPSRTGRIRASAQRLRHHPSRGGRGLRTPWHSALKTRCGQAPDVILIGEIRDRETMEYGSSSPRRASGARDLACEQLEPGARTAIINFFPDERREQLLRDLSLNIPRLVAQRLIPRESGTGRIAATEIMLTRRSSRISSSKAMSPRSKEVSRARRVLA